MMYLNFFLIIALSLINPNAEADDALRELKKMKSQDYFDSAIQYKLADAVTVGNAKKIKSYINQGADANYMGNEDMTPLMWAFVKQSYNGMLGLLESGADPNLRTGSISPLETAAMMEDSKYLNALLQFGGNVNEVMDETGRTIIFKAVLHERKDNVLLLIENGANINRQSNAGESLLSYAISIDSYEIAWMLLKQGTDPKLEDRWGYDSFDLINQFGKRGIKKGTKKYKYYEKVRDELARLKSDNSMKSESN